MSIKYYGIFLAYAPTVDLRKEGLGRHLIAFLKATTQRDDVRFLVACPSWSKDSLLELCGSEGVNPNDFEIITPSSKPILLRAFEFYQAYRARPRKLGRLLRIANVLRLQYLSHRHWVEAKFASSRSIWSLLILSFYLLMLGLIIIPFALTASLISFARSISPWVLHFIKRQIKKKPQTSLAISKLRTLTNNPKDNSFSYRLFRFMEKHELALLVQQINSLKHVAAWYSPTAFWPVFNQISAPRLMCVPDVVLTEFPIGFANVGGNRFLENFQQVECAIRGCGNFVTYSEQIKWSTLVERYAISADTVHVIHHAPNNLNQWVTISNFPDAEATSTHYCQWLLSTTTYNKASNSSYANGFLNSSVRFIFYASQFRPNKNVLSLLRAYEHLLRKRFIGHKLILTGRQAALPEVGMFIRKHHLENDVLCLHGLTTAELAACYRLADLAVNPSLSEGGCPFTFTEALSVGTPVVMARIPVTMEVLNNQSLDKVMFFDPYNWKDMADRIEWAIHHRDELLTIQKPIYDQLTQRTWGDVVNEYIEILDKISLPVNQSGIVEK